MTNQSAKEQLTSKQLKKIIAMYERLAILKKVHGIKV